MRCFYVPSFNQAKPVEITDLLREGDLGLKATKEETEVPGKETHSDMTSCDIHTERPHVQTVDLTLVCFAEATMLTTKLSCCSALYVCAGENLLVAYKYVVLKYHKDDNVYDCMF